jgi:hypothetical protein
MKTIREKARLTPVANEVDVLVCGGGPAGAAAAISAARSGARTLLVEAQGCLGGMWTLGLQVHATCFNDGRRVIVGGIAREIIDRLCALGAAEDPEAKLKTTPPSAYSLFYSAFDPDRMKGVLDQMAGEAGVRTLFHTACVGALVEKGRVGGVITESKSGRQAIRSAVTIDCTGDADVAFFAGAPTIKGREGDGKCQPVTLTFMLAGVDYEKACRWAEADPAEREAVERRARARGDLTVPQRIGLGAPMLAPGVTYHNVTRILDVDTTSAADLSRAQIEGRRQVFEVVQYYRSCIPGFEACRLAAIAPLLGLRESRRIEGVYTLTADDVVKARAFEDGIARQNYYIDMHNPAGLGLEGRSGGQLRPPVGSFYEVPYRCLVPIEREQLLVAGRCISADREALGSARTTVCCAEMGQAAGLAAAWAVRDGCSVREIDGASLKQALARLGAWTDERA